MVGPPLSANGPSFRSSEVTSLKRRRCRFCQMRDEKLPRMALPKPPQSKCRAPGRFYFRNPCSTLASLERSLFSETAENRNRPSDCGPQSLPTVSSSSRSARAVSGT